MSDTNKKIAEMVDSMQFERKKPKTAQEKEMYTMLKSSLQLPINDLGKLNVRLWHAIFKNDYHSLNLEDAKQALEEIKDEIEEILDERF